MAKIRKYQNFKQKVNSKIDLERFSRAFFIFVIFSIPLILSVNLVSSLEFDNIKNYNSETKTIDIRNSVLGIPFLQLDKVSELILKTPQTVTVGAGYGKVAEFEIIMYEDYANAFKKMEFYDIKNNMNEINREFDYKYKQEVQEQRNIYEWKCDKGLNATGGTDVNCKREVVGHDNLTNDKWFDLEDYNFNKGEVLTIGIFTDVQVGDYVEWIPNFFGVRINEWASWNASLETLMLGYYDFNDTGKLDDKHDGTHNMTITNSPNTTQECQVQPYCWGNTGATAGALRNVQELGGEQGTLNWWWVRNANSFDSNNYPIDASNRFFVQQYAGNDINFRIGTVDVDFQNIGDELAVDVPIMFTLTWDTNANIMHFYVNGTERKNDTSDFDYHDEIWTLMYDADGGVGFNGNISEFMLWNRTLVYDEIQQLWDGGTGMFYPPADNNPPDVVINSPQNTTYATSQILFNVTATDGDGIIVGCNVTIDDGVTNNTLTQDGTTDYYNWTNTSVQDGTYQALYECFDEDDAVNNTEVISFVVDTTFPEIEIVFPTNNSNQTSNTLEVNYTYSESASDTCWYSNDSYLENTSLASCGTNITGITWIQGQHNVTIWINDTSGNENQSSVTFYIDSIVPDIEIVYPPNLTNFTTNQFSINYTYGDTNVDSCWYSNDSYLENTSLASCGTNITGITWAEGEDTVIIWINDTFNNLNQSEITFTVDTVNPSITITSPNQTVNLLEQNENISIHINLSDATSNLDYCNWEYKGTNTTVDCATLDFIDVNETSLYNIGDNSITAFANDTAGNVNITSYSWTTIIGLENNTYNENSLQGSQETFRVNITLDNSYSLSVVNLIYNNTENSGSITNWGSDRYEITETIITPNISEYTNFSFYWNFKLTDGTVINSSSNNQTVLNLSIDDCTAFGTELLNLTLRDEETKEVMNATLYNSSVEVDVLLYANDQTTLILNFSQNYSENNNPRVCINQNLTDTTDYYLTSQIRYDADSYSAEFYNIQLTEITNATIPQNIDLYDLLDADTQKFLVTYKDENFLPDEDVLINIQRKYVADGVFRTVEIPQTDDNGQTLAHLDLDSVVYTFIVTENGAVLSTFDNIVPACQDIVIGDCRINLNSAGSTIETENWEGVGNINYSMTFNELTRTITTTFVTRDGSVKTIDINATKYDRFGNLTVCNDTLTSSSGTLTCTVADSFGNLTLIASLYSDGKLISEKIFSIVPDVDEYFGIDGAVMVLIMMITIPLMLVTSTIGVILGIIIGLIMASLLMIFRTPTLFGVASSIFWAIIAGGIIIWKISNRE